MARTQSKPKPSLRSEVRAIVDEAKRARKPIWTRIIWGLMSEEVPEWTLITLLSSMCGSHQIRKVTAPKYLKLHGCAFCYEPGPVPVKDGKRGEMFSRAMGNMQMIRLVDARADAKCWLAGELKAAA